MINLIICGVSGKMGANVLELLKDDKDIEVVCGVDPKKSEIVTTYESFEKVDKAADVIIDFSSPNVLESELIWASEHNAAVVLATTGYSEKQLEIIDGYSKKIAVFKSANFSLGVNLLTKLVREAAKTLGEKFDIEIIEKHHSQKADAPSGTAYMLAESANSAYDNKKTYVYGRQGIVGKRGSEIGIHAVRGGNIVGEHEVLFAGEDEVITLSHSARSKKVFASGAIAAAKWIKGKPAGKYSMRDLLDF